ncbi:hypothetical protein POJ06DRAFT_64211 [Lipomyces tetrasporus]|uniref:Uncharacterized protein n=1 Tax=Lipomyces tetrasporus TaxID=54092 RepID=A0AAD7R093_9ASCO|nr:uncharacterized protein POJ06DRAFT_64211 [Lipomyces tetrasporus]KAJ8103142.1 hypothetical protein POJ06DRAFT_64211 [Lipomyces tetrasporus]
MPLDPELETVDLTKYGLFDDVQVVDVSQSVVDATLRSDSENKTATAPQLLNVGEAKKKFKFSEKHPERDEVLLLELTGMDNKPYLSSHGDKLAGWTKLAKRCMITFQSRCTDSPDGAVLTGRHAKERFETLMKQQAEHNTWLQQASGVEVETTALKSIKEDVICPPRLTWIARARRMRIRRSQESRPTISARRSVTWQCVGSRRSSTIVLLLLRHRPTGNRRHLQQSRLLP